MSIRGMRMNIFSNPWVIGIGGGLISGLLVALIYGKITSYPKVTLIIHRVDVGSISWPSDTQDKTYILLKFDTINEEKNPIPIPLKAFQLLIKTDGGSVGFEKVFIPSSGTSISDTPQHNVGSANIDHVDLQKYTQLIVGKQRGTYNYEAIPEIMSPQRAKLASGSQYLLFQTSKVSLNDLDKSISDLRNGYNPLKITWENHSGKSYKAKIKIGDDLLVTEDCYYVGPTIKPFVYDPEKWN